MTSELAEWQKDAGGFKYQYLYVNTPCLFLRSVDRGPMSVTIHGRGVTLTVYSCLPNRAGAMARGSGRTGILRRTVPCIRR